MGLHRFRMGVLVVPILCAGATGAAAGQRELEAEGRIYRDHTDERTVRLCADLGPGA